MIVITNWVVVVRNLGSVHLEIVTALEQVEKVKLLGSEIEKVMQMSVSSFSERGYPVDSFLRRSVCLDR